MRDLHVVAAIIISNGKVLACRRASHKVSGGLWEFPGGKVEVGEHPRAALDREIFEELGLVVQAGLTFDKSVTKVSEDLTVLLECLLVEHETMFDVQSADHDAFMWLAPSEMLSLSWAAPDLPAVTKLSNMTTFSLIADQIAQARNRTKGLEL